MTAKREEQNGGASGAHLTTTRTRRNAACAGWRGLPYRHPPRHLLRRQKRAGPARAAPTKTQEARAAASCVPESCSLLEARVATARRRAATEKDQEKD